MRQLAQPSTRPVPSNPSRTMPTSCSAVGATSLASWRPRGNRDPFLALGTNPKAHTGGYDVAGRQARVHRRAGEQDWTEHGALPCVSGPRVDRTLRKSRIQS